MNKSNNRCYGCNKTEEELVSHFRFICNCCQKAGWKLKRGDGTGHYIIEKPDGTTFYTKRRGE